MMASAPPPAFVLSLDFELHWGVRHRHTAESPYRRALEATPAVIDGMLERFERHGISATWATVGFLFLRHRSERARFEPPVRPRYLDGRLDAYAEPVGQDEADDPIHYAPSVIDRIRSASGQEIATHTYSHFFCGEPGATPEAFRADLESARKVAEDRGLVLRSIVFPRNQSASEYLQVLPAMGIDVFRGNPPNILWRVEDGEVGRLPLRRLGRLLDAYIPATHGDVLPWHEIIREDGLADVRACRLLRPYDPRLDALEGVRARRITHAMARAARESGVFHLWWHPHNFGLHPAESLAMLDRILNGFARLRERFGMRSMTMAQAADEARQFYGPRG